MANLPEIPGLKIPELPRPVRLEDVPRLLQSAETLMDDLNVRAQTILDKLNTALERMQQVPEGEVFPVEVNITGTRATEYNIEDESDAGYKPWFSCTIYNDGNDDLYVAVNSSRRRFQKVLQGEALDVDMHSPKIKTLYFKTATVGGSCSLRIVGER
ncbi:MAG: hypothetical protein ABIH46_06285 [Chloroflexota bacterium]